MRPPEVLDIHVLSDISILFVLKCSFVDYETEEHIITRKGRMTLLWIRNSSVSVSASVPNVDFVLKVAIMFTQEN